MPTCEPALCSAPRCRRTVGHTGRCGGQERGAPAIPSGYVRLEELGLLSLKQRRPRWDVFAVLNCIMATTEVTEPDSSWYCKWKGMR